jgi:hypothetical protein
VEGRFFVPGSITRVMAWGPVHAAVPLAEEPAPAAGGSLHDPPLEPRDEAVFLLTAAAEIEHALMTQYLYATYSIRLVDEDVHQQDLQTVHDLLAQIAREEMGHLSTVQNLLHIVGGPLNFGREHSPYDSAIYPFRFMLEPLTLASLAKYVIAESPANLPADLSAEDKTLIAKIYGDAVAANDGQEVQHVGVIYERLTNLISDPTQGLRDHDIRLDTYKRQAKFEDWGHEPPRAQAGEALIIDSFQDGDPAQIRAAAADAIRRVGEQGEGFDIPPAGPGNSESHFERFLDIYKRVSALSSAGVTITWPVATNPNTTAPAADPPETRNAVEAALEAQAFTGRITNPQAKAWAHLFNLRYRLLLQQLSHFLQLENDPYVSGPDPHSGDRTARGLLLTWTFDEMRRLKKIAGKLVQLPMGDPPGPTNAGPPFELPYTLHLPDGEPQRWRTHLDASRAASRLIRTQLQPDDRVSSRDGFLDDLLSADANAQSVMQSLAEGHGVPPESLPADFHKVVSILEEAVRGFTIGGLHGNFWASKTRDQFLQSAIGPVDMIQGAPNPDPAAAPLVQRLEGSATGNRMPRFRPPVPAVRIAFIRQWIAQGCPDSTPSGQVGVQHERDPFAGSGTVPTTLGFESDIKALFRENPDRNTMLAIAGFDLHLYEDVRNRASDIAARLEDGSMPCDDSWPPERIATFKQWIAEGMQP